MISEERLLKIILAPHISEKSTNLAEAQKTYVFRVAINANKQEIKEAVEKLFETTVAKVTTVKQKGKQKRHGIRMGRRNDFKKAYVTLTEDANIDFANEAAE